MMRLGEHFGPDDGALQSHFTGSIKSHA